MDEGRGVRSSAVARKAQGYRLRRRENICSSTWNCQDKFSRRTAGDSLRLVNDESHRPTQPPRYISRMAQQASFDVTTGVDLQEVDNAVNQAQKEISQRYDFKGSPATIELKRTEGKIALTAENDYKMEALWEIGRAHV